MTRRAVVVVEDDAHLAWALSTQLEDLGYAIVGTATTAREAVATVLSLRPSAVLMDIQLDGDASGLDAARQIRRASSVPILFCSVFAEAPGVADQVRDVGNSGIVGKPVTEQQLQGSLTRLLSTARPANTNRKAPISIP